MCIAIKENPNPVNNSAKAPYITTTSDALSSVTDRCVDDKVWGEMTYPFPNFTSEMLKFGMDT